MERGTSGMHAQSLTDRQKIMVLQQKINVSRSYYMDLLEIFGEVLCRLLAGDHIDMVRLNHRLRNPWDVAAHSPLFWEDGAFKFYMTQICEIAGVNSYPYRRHPMPRSPNRVFPLYLDASAREDLVDVVDVCSLVFSDDSQESPGDVSYGSEGSSDASYDDVYLEVLL